MSANRLTRAPTPFPRVLERGRCSCINRNFNNAGLRRRRNEHEQRDEREQPHHFQQIFILKSGSLQHTAATGVL